MLTPNNIAVEPVKPADGEIPQDSLPKASPVEPESDPLPVAPDAAKEGPSLSLDTPKTTQPITINWPYAIILGTVHLLCLLIFVPYFFSWSGLALAIMGDLVFGLFGINIGYHRLLTHRGFSCPKWFEHTLAMIGICNLQDSPARWVAIHRLHHKHTDEQPDPHSPLVNFLWGHVGWLLVVNRDHYNLLDYERYSRDMLRDRFYLKLERRFICPIIYLVHASLFVVAGFGVGYWLTGTFEGGQQLGLSWLVWGVIARTVYVLNGTWSVNSLGHLFGYQNYDTGDRSMNNWLVGLVAHGEGWHNNHHADQRSARHGHRWWEIDLSWLTIRLLERIGLVWNVARPSQKLIAARALKPASE